jgi:hypothetical protein
MDEGIKVFKLKPAEERGRSLRSTPTKVYAKLIPATPRKLRA